MREASREGLLSKFDFSSVEIWKRVRHIVSTKARAETTSNSADLESARIE